MTLQHQNHVSVERASHALLCGLCCLGGLLLVACGGSTAAGPRKSPGVVVQNEGSCAPENLTATCTCEDQNNIPGRQTCAGAMWGACECIAPAAGTAGNGVGAGDAGPQPQGTLEDPPGNSSANRFNWQRTPFELGSCKVGHYVGNFQGFYASPAIFQIPVPVMSVTDPVTMLPGLEFWLNKKPGSGEVFSIDNGKMRGNADGFVPFTIDLTGSLDCKTKKFSGMLINGIYTVGMPYMFEGTFDSDYDKIQNMFIGGTWQVTEPSSTTTPPAGGDGHPGWDATWTAN